jgi:hypothetical protein
LIVAVATVAGVIGISGINPQIINTGRIPDAGLTLPVMSLSDSVTRTTGLGTVATTALPSPRVVTTGQGSVSPSRPTPAFDTNPQCWQP